MVDTNVISRKHRQEVSTSKARTLDLELIRDAASDIQVDVVEVLQIARGLPEVQAQGVIGKAEKLQEIVAEIQADLSELPLKS